MKILYILNSINPKEGGVANCVISIVTQHLRSGVDAEIVCLDSPTAEYVRDLNNSLVIHALDDIKWKYGYSSILKKWLNTNALRYDIFIINGLWQYCSFVASRVAIKYHIPYLLFTHGMLDMWFKQKYPLKHLKKLLYWLLIERFTVLSANRVLYTSGLEELASQKTFPFYVGNSVVLNLGIAPPNTPTEKSKSFFLNKFHLPKNKILLLFLSRIHEKKGCDILIETFSSLSKSFPDIHLIISGSGDSKYIKYLNDLATSLGVDNQITWTGMLTGTEKWSAFSISDVFLLPSHQENFGIAVVEALACGVPVLISDKINIHKVIDFHRCGFVFNDDQAGTQNGLIQWLSLSEAEKVKMKSNAFHCFDNNFKIEDTERCLVDIISSTI